MGMTTSTPQAASSFSPGGIVVTIGDISCTSDQVITPAGMAPLAHAQWHVVDRTHTVRRIPRWAIVVAVVGFFFMFVFALLFLLTRETVIEGDVQVTVLAPGLSYTTQVSVLSQDARAELLGSVATARAMSASAS